jgi:hypothetical protein
MTVNKIALLNDQLRLTMATSSRGRVVMTAGVAALPEEDVALQAPGKIPKLHHLRIKAAPRLIPPRARLETVRAQSRRNFGRPRSAIEGSLW